MSAGTVARRHSGDRAEPAACRPSRPGSPTRSARRCQLLGAVRREAPAAGRGQRRPAGRAAAARARDRQGAAVGQERLRDAPCSRSRRCRRTSKAAKADAPGPEPQERRLQRDGARGEEQPQVYESLLQRENELRVSSNSRANNVRVVDHAEVPKAPIAPTGRRTWLMSLARRPRAGGRRGRSASTT